MKLIAGLGNPGQRYTDTRHNIGFRVIDELAERYGIKLKKRLFGSARQTQFRIFGEGLTLIQPLSFMNLSGRCIAHYMNRYDIPLDSILIICDDINLPFGEIRIRPEGTSGGHNGLESIIRALKTTAFPRLRIGIRIEQPISSFKEYVLSDFEEDESPKVEESIHHAVDACVCWAREGIDKAMNLYNK